LDILDIPTGNVHAIALDHTPDFQNLLMGPIDHPPTGDPDPDTIEHAENPVPEQGNY
jgi:hypothetical protein